jgi:hypothetical protein
MKMYKVFECEGHTFKWSGGCTINIRYWEGLEYKKETLEFFESYDDSEVARLCLDWLVSKGLIEDSTPYLFC